MLEKVCSTRMPCRLVPATDEVGNHKADDRSAVVVPIEDAEAVLPKNVFLDAMV
jgi:hypothetical protein